MSLCWELTFSARTKVAPHHLIVLCRVVQNLTLLINPAHLEFTAKKNRPPEGDRHDPQPASPQNVIFKASWVLNGSPAPMPGAPLKSPIVSYNCIVLIVAVFGL